MSFPNEGVNNMGELDIPFISKLMSLAFLGNMTRPDILTPLSVLASRVTKTTQSDYTKLQRIWNYTTRHLVLTLKPDSLVVHGISDASYAGNSDRTSQSGIIVSLGFDDKSNNVTGNVHSSSKKQRVVVTSSCEAELVTQSDECLKYVLWLRKFMKALGHGHEHSYIHQDNMSAIDMGTKGQGSFKKSKHVDIRYFFISEKIASGIIKLKYVPTKLMVADILTKPLQGKLLRDLRGNLMNSHNFDDYVGVNMNFMNTSLEEHVDTDDMYDDDSRIEEQVIDDPITPHCY